jgi:hypothetical protein
VLPPNELRRRVKAARALAGFGSTKDLAKAIGNDAKLGDRTLRTLEGDSAPRTFRAAELNVIARACGVDPSFFSIDFRSLNGETVENRVALLEQAVSRLAGLDWETRDADRAQELEHWLLQDESHPEEDESGSETQEGE